MKWKRLIALAALITFSSIASRFDDQLKLAEQGDAGAQYNLAIIYGKGLGTPQDYKKAYIWFSISASSGHEEAIKGRDTLTKVMMPKTLREAQEEASKIYYRINNAKG